MNYPDYINDLEPMPKTGTIGVGRTLLDAIGVLDRGEVVQITDAQGTVTQVQVYDADRRTLLTRIAGETGRATNASASQMAAIIAYQALNPKNGFDAALAGGSHRMHTSGSPVAAMDSAYIVIKNNLLYDKNRITLGGQVGTQKCPDCGQFMGAAHNCPTPSQPPVPVAVAPAVPVVVAPAVPAAPDPVPVAPPADPVPVAPVAPVVIAPEVTV